VVKTSKKGGGHVSRLDQNKKNWKFTAKSIAGGLRGEAGNMEIFTECKNLGKGWGVGQPKKPNEDFVHKDREAYPKGTIKKKKKQPKRVVSKIRQRD